LRRPCLFAFEGQKREPVGVLVIALLHAECEEHDRAENEHQAHENLESYDFHREPFVEREAVVRTTTLSDESGMNTAQRSGDMSPAHARPTATAL
jgi:hypothetical protein